MSSFDNRKQIKFSADAPSFSAVIMPGTAVQTAVLTWKKGWKVGAPSITTSTMDQLMAELSRLDAGVKFYKRGANEGTLSPKDAAMLAQLRDDKNTSDAVYRTACASFNQKPEPRSVTAASVASTANLPQGVPALRASAEAWMAFETAHGELFQPPYGVLNLRAIEQYFADEKVQWTADSLAQCYRELKAANCFRDARTLTRGMSGSFTIVQPYSHERILAMRRQQVADVANQPPAGLSDVDRECWEAVHRAYPQLSVNSDSFKKCCRATLEKWSREFVLETNPSFNATDGKGRLLYAGEWQAAADKVLAGWVRQGNSKLKLGGKGSVKLWLD